MSTNDENEAVYEDAIQKLALIIEEYKSAYEKSHEENIILKAEIASNQNDNLAYIEELESALSTLDEEHNETLIALSGRENEISKLQQALNSIEGINKESQANESENHNILSAYDDVMTTNQRLLGQIKELKKQLEENEDVINNQSAQIIDLQSQLRERNNNNSSSFSIRQPKLSTDTLESSTTEKDSQLQNNPKLSNEIINKFKSDITTPSKQKSKDSVNLINHARGDKSPHSPHLFDEKNMSDLIQNIRSKQNFRSKSTSNVINVSSSSNNNNNGSGVIFSKPRTLVLDKNSQSWASATTSDNLLEATTNDIDMETETSSLKGNIPSNKHKHHHSSTTDNDTNGNSNKLRKKLKTPNVVNEEDMMLTDFDESPSDRLSHLSKIGVSDQNITNNNSSSSSINHVLKYLSSSASNVPHSAPTNYTSTNTPMTSHNKILVKKKEYTAIRAFELSPQSQPQIRSIESEDSINTPRKTNSNNNNTNTSSIGNSMMSLSPKKLLKLASARSRNSVTVYPETQLNGDNAAGDPSIESEPTEPETHS